MNPTNSLNIQELFSKVLGDKIDQFDLPPPSFTVMQCEVIAFDEVKKTLTTKIPVLKSWLNPYGTMQGGMITAGIDNTVGPLSFLIAPPNMTRNIETKYLTPITMDLEYVYAKAFLVEEKKRRLTFEVSVEDEFGEVYARAKVVNFIL